MCKFLFFTFRQAEIEIHSSFFHIIVFIIIPWAFYYFKIMNIVPKFMK